MRGPHQCLARDGGQRGRARALRPKPDLAQITGGLADVRTAAQTAVDAPAGLGAIASYASEVALPAAGTCSHPGRGSSQADIITAPEDGIPLLFVEIDNCFARQLAELTERHWKGTAYEGGFPMYDGKLPVVVTWMKQLKELGPGRGRSSGASAGPRDQSFLEEIGNERR